MRLKRILNIAYFLVLFFASQQILFSQDTILLRNPSFEDFPQVSSPPAGWTDCGFPGETAPDVQPSGYFGVFWPAMDGETYLGMVTREHETYETVGQKMSGILWSGTCYQVSFFLCKSPVYMSHIRKGGLELPRNFTTPIKLRIWGGNDMCQKEELIGETSLVENHDWERYYVKLSPKRGNYRYIFLEAYYQTPVLFPYNGNVLVDDMSEIVEMGSCEEEFKKHIEVEPPIVEILSPAEKIDEKRRIYRIYGKISNVYDPQKVYMAINDFQIKNFTYNRRSGDFSAYVKLIDGKNVIKLIGSNEAGTDTNSTVIRTVNPNKKVIVHEEISDDEGKDASTPHPSLEPEIEINKYEFARKDGKKSLKKGDVINLDHLQFKPNEATLSDQDTKILEDLFDFLVDYPAVRVEIGGHTNGIPDWNYCLKLSTERAKAVADYLIDRGISFKRLRVVGYGKKYPIATNATAEGRKKNQRVEIKIITVGG